MNNRSTSSATGGQAEMPLRMPAEWEAHDKIWIGFPSDRREWPVDMEAAQREVADFASALCDGGHDGGNGEKVILVTGDDDAMARAKQICDPGVTVVRQKMGDIWLRDTGCITMLQSGGARMARNFRFNGWGGKYLMDGDQDIGRHLAEQAGLTVTDCDWILEGGAIDVDGTGRAVTTRQCLLNPNRNPAMTQAEVEAALHRDLGIDRLLWLGDGLIGDHTDGHVDNLARFIAPGHLILPHSAGSDDPNAEIYDDALAQAQAQARDYGIKISMMPSPGRIEVNGEIAPASYMNFCIGNRAVIVPAFGVPQDEAAKAALAAHFPDRKIVSLPSLALLRGGGSFHCCSQQVTIAKAHM